MSGLWQYLTEDFIALYHRTELCAFISYKFPHFF
jgi:hypothetical protein